MSQRSAKPNDIKTLQDWVKRWPKVSNLDFNKETREPTIYTNDAARTTVGTIPWKREADIVTVLCQPDRFATGAVAAARKRIGVLTETQGQLRVATEEQMRALEAALLEAWRSYRAAPSAPLLRDVLAAEKALNDLEMSQGRNRAVIMMGDYMTTYTPIVPLKQRGLPIAEITT